MNPNKSLILVDQHHTVKVSTIDFRIDIAIGLTEGIAYDEEWIRLLIDGVDVIKTPTFEGAYDFDMVCRTLTGSGKYLIFNCICGFPSCGGWNSDGIDVRHDKNHIEWWIPERDCLFRFEKRQYQEAIAQAKANIEPIKAYEIWCTELGNQRDPLLWAITSGRNEVLAELLRASSIQTDSMARKYASYIVEADNSEGLKLILERFDIIELKDERGLTLFHQAARENSVACVQSILSQSINLQVCDKKGWTALDYALFENHIEVIALLSQKGIDKKTDDERWSSLSML